MSNFHHVTTFIGDQPAAAQDDDLIDRRELALVAVERTRMPMVVTDPRRHDNPIILANQAFIDLTGYSADEIVGRNCRFLQGRDTAVSDVAKLREAFMADEDDIDVELVNYRKDGTAFLNSLKISAVRSAEGELLYYFASQEDVTAERKAQELEASERRLLMEVDHRTMNALALIQSIVRLSRAEDVQGLSNSITARVEALGQTHRLLAQNRWRSVGLSDLVTAQIALPLIGDRVNFEGESVPLLPHIVQPLGLVLHELLSNAKVHGALTKERGAIRLRWTTEYQTLTLQWLEAIPGLPSGQFNEGFGLQILRTVVEDQLGGEQKLKFQEDVLEVAIVVPDAIALADRQAHRG